MVHLDGRLRAVADLAGSVQTLYDIGANHGLLSAYMLEAGLCRRACITDISRDALKRARYNLGKAGLLDRAEFVVTDGLKGLSPAVGDAVVISGMGTQVISGILAGADTDAPFILQPTWMPRPFGNICMQTGLPLKRNVSAGQPEGSMSA